MSSFVDQPVDFDDTAPLLENARVTSDGRLIILTFNEFLEPFDDYSYFTVTADQEDVPIRRIHSSDDFRNPDQVIIELDETIGQNQVVTIEYIDPSTDDNDFVLQDEYGNDVATFTQSVENDSTQDVTGPELLSGTVQSDGITISLSYDEQLQSQTDFASYFDVNVDGQEFEIVYSETFYDYLELYLGDPISEGQEVTIDYFNSSDGDGFEVQDILGNGAESVSNFEIDNNSLQDLLAPELLSLQVEENGAQITLIYNETLSDVTAESHDFSLSVDGNVIDNQIAGVSTFQDEVRLDLVNRIGIGQVVGISYYDSSEYDNNYISDEARNSAASFTDLSLENKSTQDITPPEFVSAETSVDGTQIILEYNENMNVDNVDIERFGVYIEDELVAISGISSVENKVFLDLTQTAGSNQFVKVNYDDPSPTDDQVGALEDVDGNDSPSIFDFSVFNNSVETPPTIDTFSIFEDSSQPRINDLFKISVGTNPSDEINYIQVFLENHSDHDVQYESIIFDPNEINNSTAQHTATRDISTLTHGLWKITGVKVQNSQSVVKTIYPYPDDGGGIFRDGHPPQVTHAEILDLQDVYGGNFGFNLSVDAEDSQTGLSKVEANFLLMDGVNNEPLVITKYFDYSSNAFEDPFISPSEFTEDGQYILDSIRVFDAQGDYSDYQMITSFEIDNSGPQVIEQLSELEVHQDQINFGESLNVTAPIRDRISEILNTSGWFLEVKLVQVNLK